MKRNKLLVILPLIPLLITGCNNSSNKTNNKDEYIINDFESIEQLSLMKFPSPSHNNRGRMELSNEHVSRGNKSLKYYNEFGTSIEMCHYFDHIVDQGIDISNMKSINIDIYNDSDFDTTGSFYIYANDDLSTVLSYEFPLKKQEMNHIEFLLSKVAIEYNVEQIRATSLRLFTQNTDYDKNIFYTFYLDNWVAVMGSEYTETDKMYNSIINDIKTKIEDLPNIISLNDEETLQEIADLIDSLPDLYRGAIPNLAAYKAAVSAFNDAKLSSQVIDYDMNSFLDLDKFYGISQLKPDNGEKAEIIYSHDKWDGNEYEGSTKVIFSGTTSVRLVYNGNVDLNAFDFVYFTVHNSSPNYIRIWLSYINSVFMDIAPNKTQVASFAASLIAGQSFWNVDSLYYNPNGNPGGLVPSSGAIYFSHSYVVGRSQETLMSQMEHAFATMTDIDELNSEDDYLKGFTSIDAARKLYELIEDKSLITDEQIAKLEALETKYESDGYGMCYSTYDGSIQKFGYGQEFTSKIGVSDETFGFVSTANITENVPNSNRTVYEQGFNYANDVVVSNRYNGYVCYIYSPLDHLVNAFIHSSNWDNWTTNYITVPLSSGWNKIEIPPLIVNDSVANKFAVVIADDINTGDLTGEWKFSSLFAVPRVITYA